MPRTELTPIGRSSDLSDAELVHRYQRMVYAVAVSVVQPADVQHRPDEALDVLDDRVPVAPRLLHVLNGDSVRQTLEHSDVPGAFAPYADVLHEGPVPHASGTAEWRETRARYASSSGYGSYHDVLVTYQRWDAQLASFDDYDEVVLWFEHDLFDQLLLVRHLTGLPAVTSAGRR